MFSDDDAGRIARAFELGDGAAFTGTVARGEQGQVAQLETSRGLWAVKASFRPPELDGEDGAFQAAAVAAGVPAPAVVFTAGGELFTDVGGLPVRVYGWVDVLPPDSGLDPGRVGRLMAAIHQVPFHGRRPQDPWYTEPVGWPSGWRQPAPRSPVTWPRCAMSWWRWRGYWRPSAIFAPATATCGRTTFAPRPTAGSA